MRFKYTQILEDFLVILCVIQTRSEHIRRSLKNLDCSTYIRNVSSSDSSFIMTSPSNIIVGATLFCLKSLKYPSSSNTINLKSFPFFVSSGDIGGQVGLFLGASILTVLEFGDLLARIIVNKIKRNQRRHARTVWRSQKWFDFAWKRGNFIR